MGIGLPHSELCNTLNQLFLCLFVCGEIKCVIILIPWDDI